MIRPLSFSVLGLTLCLVLSACTAPKVSSSGSVSSQTSVPEQSISEVPSSTVLNPGCRNDLGYPMLMEEGSTATDFTAWQAEDIDGNQYNHDILKQSKVTVVAVWSSFCGSCVSDLTALQQLYEEYDRKDVNIVGIVASAKEADGSISQSEVNIVRQLQELTGAAFVQLLPSDDLIAIKLKDVDLVPETFFLDSHGNLLGESVYGGRTAEEFRALIDEALTQANHQ
ncbi:MAG: TlpA disulfide reductase family protein [Angelakisella sp.]|nr:TlpA disulfide reductase family protein [Angelakisella sp.]